MSTAKMNQVLSMVPTFFVTAFLLGLPNSITAQTTPEDGPRYTGADNLILPEDYRSWPFIGAGLGMTYDEGGTPEQGQVQDPTFSHVFVNPSAYRYFMETGTWPDGSVFILEFRRSKSEGSINVAGRYATELVLVEAEVKDSRFPDGWAFYTFGPGNKPSPVAEPLVAPAVDRCVQCHTENAAVERTFVQFYPTLLEVAREKGTLNPGYVE